MIRKIIGYLKRKKACSSSERFCEYLRRKGLSIGVNTHFDPKSSVIDITRPSLVRIGDNCYFNKNFTLLTHDWVAKVFIESNREFLPSSGRVTIGNNVSFGQNVMVLKGVTIGDNCFIGAGSIVTKDIVANSIAVGAPCKVVMTVEEYYQRRKVECLEESLDYAYSIQERYGRRPVTTDFWEEFPLFIDGDKIEQYPELAAIIKSQCGPSYEYYVKNHKAKYKDFDAFIKAAGL